MKIFCLHGMQVSPSWGSGVMAGYPEIDDEPAHGSRKWLTAVLRRN